MPTPLISLKCPLDWIYLLALNTVGHNVSNAAVPGYTRQRVHFEPNAPDVKSFGVLGSGTTIKSVARVADDFLDMQVREAGTAFSYLETITDNYMNLEAVLV